MKRALGWVLGGSLVVTVACGSTDEDGGKPSGPSVIGAPGVVLSELAIYQGPKRVLMTAGQPGDGVPLVAGRDALFRVYHVTTPDYDGQPVTARLDLLDGQPPLEQTLVMSPGANEADLASTLTFAIPGARIGTELNYTFTIEQAANGRTDNPGSRFAQTVPVAGKANTFRLMIVPYQYNADGSGRLPDTSPEMVEKYRQRFLALYPVSNVEVSVHAPVAWSQAIQPDGTGWQSVGFNLYGLRISEGIPDDVYLYGVFQPTANLGQFCFGGCLLGVTLLNDDPPDVGNVQLRLALGVGYADVALNTAAHEIGHAHGRGHANCGPGIAPNSLDPTFPHAKGGIGVWGWDLTTGALQDPAVATDIMSYCKNQFISDYNYQKLFDRTQNVNLPSVIAKPAEYFLIGDDGLGAREMKKVALRGLPPGREVAVRVDTMSEKNVAATGWYTPYDHLPGGWLLVPATVGTVIDARVDG